MVLNHRELKIPVGLTWVPQRTCVQLLISEGDDTSVIERPLGKHLTALLRPVVREESVRLDAPQDAVLVCVEPLLLTKENVRLNTESLLNVLLCEKNGFVSKVVASHDVSLVLAVDLLSWR